jgi:hydrogenase maturation protease
MKKIMIIGMGDVLKGDYGAGCIVLEKLAETVIGEDIEFAYLGQDTRLGCGFLYGADLAIVVGALNLSGMPGVLHCWNAHVFQQHAPWMTREFRVIHGLTEALARADLADGLPRHLCFIFMEPLISEGYGISDPVQRTVTKAVHRILQEIWQFRLKSGSYNDAVRGHRNPVPLECRPIKGEKNLANHNQ